MKIETNKTPKQATSITFIAGQLSKFVEQKNGQELQIGRGKEEALSRRKMVIFLRKIVSLAKQNKLKRLALQWSDIRDLAADLSDEELGEMLAVAFHMAEFEFTTYKKKPEDGFPTVEAVFISDVPADAAKAIQRGEIIAAEVNATRTLANTPGGDMTPKKFAAAAKEALKGTKATLKVLGRAEMQKLGMGAVLGIAQGSAEEPQFLIAEYWGASKSKKPLVLVGKGVTFDTGGLNLKPGDSMLEMHMDMSGGAAVIRSIALAARLGLKLNVVGLVPAVENMPSGTALRPGDIVRSLSGRTIEVLNTDAEGRVILSDAITYAKRYDPQMVVECSTLTGAALIALGTQASALMSTDKALEEKLIELGERSGDYVWPLPLWEEFEDAIKGNFADVANIPASGNTRYGGVINGGMFLREFAKDLACPFAHLDIAPRMTSNGNEFLAKGAAGTPVRLFAALMRSLAQ